MTAVRPIGDAPPAERVGIISDTHGLLRPAALAFLRGCSRIIHGGDIGGERILDELRSIALVVAVRGNNDADAWASYLNEHERLQIQDVWLYAVHDLSRIDCEMCTKDVQVVVSGHSHKPSIAEREGVLYVNPGSAGPRRFSLPIAVAELTVVHGSITARIVEL